MKVLVRGRDPQLEEFQNKFGEQLTYDTDRLNAMNIDLSSYDLVFDFFIEESPENLESYKDLEGLTLFCNSVKTSLAELSFYLEHEFEFRMLGFNGLPTFLDRELLEVTLLSLDHKDHMDKICSFLGTGYEVVEDRVGMVSPRVICMIINEAYFTVQEGTADKESIDLAMKLGTNYPMGPFEWTENMGINNVYELLEGVYEDTKDERYKICPLLKREYLLAQ
jgi:3-hydroxybutyryl-CoA dehydrogenase